MHFYNSDYPNEDIFFNLGTFNKNFETNIPWKYLFKRSKNIKTIFFSEFFESVQTLHLNLKTSL